MMVAVMGKCRQADFQCCEKRMRAVFEAAYPSDPACSFLITRDTHQLMAECPVIA
jgi:hypothetical protein